MKAKNIGFSNPKNIKYFKDLNSNTYCDCYFDNLFSVFNSLKDIVYLIYSQDNNIISYNLINNQKINEIKEAHEKNIINFRYYLDKFLKRDLLISIAFNNNLKLWNIQNFECLLNIKNINIIGVMFSACFLNDSI